MKVLTLALISFLSFNVFALSVDGITFEEKQTVAGKELVLNGVGIRKATFLKIKVYYGALYISQKTSDASTFLTTNEPKQIIMHFVRDVEAKDLKATFKEATEKANPANFKTLLPMLEKFTSNVPDMAKGERMVVTFSADGATLTAKGKTFEKVAGADFSKGLLNMWFTNPIDENLKNSLLGK